MSNRCWWGKIQIFFQYKLYNPKWPHCPTTSIPISIPYFFKSIFGSLFNSISLFSVNADFFSSKYACSRSIVYFRVDVIFPVLLLLDTKLYFIVSLNLELSYYPQNFSALYFLRLNLYSPFLVSNSNYFFR